MTPFTLGRMRHLDLLAVWHQAHPNSRERNQRVVAGLAKDALAALILAGAPEARLRRILREEAQRLYP